jgi:SpoIIAA-like
MVLSTGIEPPDVLVATVTGTLTTGDHVRIVEWIRSTIRMAGAVRVLLKLEQFAGWTPTDASADPSLLWLDDSEPVRKVAIVGDGRWRQQALTVTAQPVRRIPIDYFETETAAREWLGSVNATPLESRAATPK